MTINNWSMRLTVGLVVVLVLATHGVHSGPAPVIASLAPASKAQELAEPSGVDAAGVKKILNAQQQTNLISTQPDQQSPSHPDPILSQQQQPLSANYIKSSQQQSANQKSPMRSLNAEKLRRGLTNFMNHLNPAPFFVPAAPLSSNVALASAQTTNPASNNKNIGSQAEPATIITDGPTADAVIKGPNRLVQARPLGGPLRWGR